MDENEIYGVFKDHILPIINLHAPSEKGIEFGILVKELLQKEKVFPKLGELKYIYTTYNKENHNTYTKKGKK